MKKVLRINGGVDDEASGKYCTDLGPKMDWCIVYLLFQKEATEGVEEEAKCSDSLFNKSSVNGFCSPLKVDEVYGEIKKQNNENTKVADKRKQLKAAVLLLFQQSVGNH